MSDMHDRQQPIPPSSQQQPPGYDVPLTQKSSGLAVAAMILGIFGLCFPPLAIAALVMGIVALTQIANPGRALTGRGMALTGTILGGVGVTLAPIALLIGILLPALGAARRAARQMQNTTQVRGVTQAMAAYGSGNRDYYPGLDSNGIPADITVEGRFAEMLNHNLFGSEYLISPSETKTVWQSGPVTTDNYSFALLDISDEGGRRDEWRQTINVSAITISDRNTGTSGADADVMSIHTQLPGDWRGSVGWGDAMASFESTHQQDVKYGSGQVHQYDNIFDMKGPDDATLIYSGD